MPIPASKKRESQQIWCGDSFAATLLVLFVDTYGVEGLTWAPETMAMEINDDFGIDIPQQNFDRLMTAVNLVNTDSFYNSLPDFIDWCNVLSGDVYDPRYWDPADSAEIAWGITEAMWICPPDENDEEPFSQDILAYIGETLDNEGIITPPDILRLGLRKQKNLAAQVQNDFSDDPILYGAIYDFEGAKTTEINDYVRNNLRNLVAQLKSLPLQTGSAANISKMFNTKS